VYVVQYDITCLFTYIVVLCMFYVVLCRKGGCSDSVREMSN